jgi:hypothetical protein
MPKDQSLPTRRIVAGVDTHKDLHVAAVVDDYDRLLASECFASTRQGYKKMLAWMRSFGELDRVGIECTGTYGAGLLRYLQQAGVLVLEVTAPDMTGPAKAWEGRRSGRAECGACGLFRDQDRDAQESRRHDRVAAGSEELQENSDFRASSGLAADPEQHRVCTRRITGEAPLAHAHAAHSNPGCMAPGSDRLPDTDICISDRVQIAWAALSGTSR